MVLLNRQKGLKATSRRAARKYILLLREKIADVIAESINKTYVRPNTDRTRPLFLLYTKEPCPTLQLVVVWTTPTVSHPRVLVVAMATELSVINEELVKRVVCILDPACPVEDRQVHQKVRSKLDQRPGSCNLLPTATFIYTSLSEHRRV